MRKRRCSFGLVAAVTLPLLFAVPNFAVATRHSSSPKPPGRSERGGGEWGATGPQLGELALTRLPNGKIGYFSQATACGNIAGTAFGSGTWSGSSFSGTGRYQSGGSSAIQGQFSGRSFSGTFMVSVPSAPGYPGCTNTVTFTGECVRACATPLKVEVTEVTPDGLAGARNDGTYFSIPPQGQGNAHQRSFTVKYKALRGTTNITSKAQVTKVTADLDSATGQTLQANIIDGGLGPTVREKAPGTLEVTVTFSNHASEVDSTPPPSDRVKYAFTVEVEYSGESGVSEVHGSATMHALWKMPGGFARYGPCDAAGHEREGPGGDDWVSAGTYSWMEENRGLLTAINDTSFEHGLNLGPHQTHATGNDIDMFHVYPLAGASQCSGGQYYDALVLSMEQALGFRHASRAQVASATQQITGWVNVTRARFDQLLALASVRRVIYAQGAAAHQNGQLLLGRGWAEDLLRTGSYGALNVAGQWGNSRNPKMRYKTDHDNHIHLALSP